MLLCWLLKMVQKLLSLENLLTSRSSSSMSWYYELSLVKNTYYYYINTSYFIEWKEYDYLLQKD